jgi:hypothetical protein
MKINLPLVGSFVYRSNRRGTYLLMAYDKNGLAMLYPCGESMVKLVYEKPENLTEVTNDERTA